MNPKYPLYIVSKGRWDPQLRKTSRALHRLGLPHYIVVESQEYDNYSAVIDDTATLLVLDPAFQRDYDTCDDLEDSKSKGPGPARNFVWEHSIDQGDAWHWVMDDNIRTFYRMNRNYRVPVSDGTIFYAMENFVERYENIAMAGPEYKMFAANKMKWPPFRTNTRIYSCNLIRNDVPYRWRGRYNEDTDLSLRMLKDQWCTVLFYAFLQDKIATQLVKGGNTADFYEKEGTYPKSQMQVSLHPDVSKLVWRYNRWHHDVDYRSFNRKLRRRKDLEIVDGVDNFGMVHQRKIDEAWVLD